MVDESSEYRAGHKHKDLLAGFCSVSIKIGEKLEYQNIKKIDPGRNAKHCIASYIPVGCCILIQLLVWFHFFSDFQKNKSDKSVLLCLHFEVC